MSSYKGEDFRSFKDHSTYFLTEDALASITHDLTFSPTRKYYCGANCQVCYIKQKLNEHLPFYSQSVPDKITDKQTQLWYDVFDYFYVIRIVDDLRLLKAQYPHVYDWYREHAATFEFGMTDNAVILQHDALMELDMKGISEIALSEDFLNKINSKKNYNKVMEILQRYIDKYKLHKIKIIKTTNNDFEYHATELVEWLHDKGVVASLHNDFRKTSEHNRSEGNTDYDLKNMFDYQNTHVLCYNDRTYQIYRGSLHFYGDRFFYSIDDATDINWDPFHTVGESFKYNDFMTDMVQGKLNLYSEFVKELSTVKDPAAIKFRDYYINTIDNFEVDREFNFVPDSMLNETSVFYSKLIDQGFKKTPVGLYKPGEQPKPIVKFK